MSQPRMMPFDLKKTAGKPVRIVGAARLVQFFAKHMSSCCFPRSNDALNLCRQWLHSGAIGPTDADSMAVALQRGR